MKTLAIQSRAELGDRMSVLSRQKRDHVKLDKLLHRLGTASPREESRVLRKIYRLVFSHAFAEEAVLWPVIRAVLPNGHALTLRVEQEHQQINQLVTRLEMMQPGSPGHRQVLQQVVELLRQDVRDEEDELLPRLQERLSKAQLRLLGLGWEAVRRIAPTRPHPIVSRRPPGNLLSALPLAILDRCRDFVDSVLDGGRQGFAAPPLRALSSGLAVTSHGLERLPGMRSGEDPSTRVGQRSRGRFGLLAVAAVGAASAAFLLSQRQRKAA